MRKKEVKEIDNVNTYNKGNAALIGSGLAKMQKVAEEVAALKHQVPTIPANNKTSNSENDGIATVKPEEITEEMVIKMINTISSPARIQECQDILADSKVIIVIVSENFDVVRRLIYNARQLKSELTLEEDDVQVIAMSAIEYSKTYDGSVKLEHPIAILSVNGITVNYTYFAQKRIQKDLIVKTLNNLRLRGKKGKYKVKNKKLR